MTAEVRTPRRIRRPSTVRLPAAAFETALVAALCALATVPFAPLFRTDVVLLGCFGAIALVAVVLGWGRSRAWSTAASTAAAVLALLVWTVVAVGRDGSRAGLPGPAAWRELWRGLTGGWSLLLTAGLPLDVRGAPAVLPVVLAGLATITAVLLQRLRLACWPVLPPLVLLIVASVFAGHRDDAMHPVVTGALVVGVLAVLARRGSQAGDALVGAPAAEQRSHPGLSSTPVLVVLVAAAGVASSLALPLVRDEDRLSLREHYRAPLLVQDAVSPLTLVSAQLSAAAAGGTDDIVFRVAFPELPAGVEVRRVPVAVLPEFDGSVWSVSARFERAGSTLPAGWEAAPDTVRVRQRYELASGWASSFVPGLGRGRQLADVDTSALGFDPASGGLVSDAGAGLSYELVSEVAIPDRAALQVDVTSTDARAAPSTALPAQLPLAVEQFAARLAAPGSSAFEWLEAVEAAFHSDDFGYSAQAAPGHSLGRIAAMLPTADRGMTTSAQRVGTPEQFASAFATLARAEGHPARVVVGYRIDPVAAATGAPLEVRVGDITAWAEVLFDGAGWVAFDPTSARQQDPVREPDDGGGETVPATPAAAAEPVRNCLELGTCIEAAGGAGRATFAGVVALALAACIPLALWLARAAQRSRRRRGGEAEQVVGSWQTSRDRLRLAGVAVPLGYTVDEVATSNGALDLDRVGDVRPALAELSTLVDAALFDPDGPPAEAVRAARAAEARITRAARRSCRRARRLRNTFDPRPLLWESQRRKAVARLRQRPAITGPSGRVPAPAPTRIGGRR